MFNRSIKRTEKTLKIWPKLNILKRKQYFWWHKKPGDIELNPACQYLILLPWPLVISFICFNMFSIVLSITPTGNSAKVFFAWSENWKLSYFICYSIASFASFLWILLKTFSMGLMFGDWAGIEYTLQPILSNALLAFFCFELDHHPVKAI